MEYISGHRLERINMVVKWKVHMHSNVELKAYCHFFPKIAQMKIGCSYWRHEEISKYEEDGGMVAGLMNAC